MKYVVEDDNKYLIFKRYIKFGDIIVVVEQTDNITFASQFDSMEDVNACLAEVKNYDTYDINNCKIMEVK